MNITDKDRLLADFMEGKISEAEILRQHPQWREEVKMLKLSRQALDQLIFPVPEKKIFLEPERRKIPKFAWYLAASVLLLLGLVFLLNKPRTANLTPFAQTQENVSPETEISRLWSMWNQEKIDASQQKTLLEQALHSENSNIRFLALQKLSQHPPALTEPELFQFTSQEQALNNQTAWLELWVKVPQINRSELKKWLDQKNVHPLVKDFGKQLISSL